MGGKQASNQNFPNITIITYMKVAMIGHESCDLNLAYCLKHLEIIVYIPHFIILLKLVVKMYIMNTM